ncbi:hypothetical protein [Sphingomonas oryzagri]|uniref:Uncharacterized protein n=1 Tax=Sphingomonas oryzagri TaxID=3042314 RepID=A0ABT6N320_9SPHN|nr:hypothetical protein [Sphingomonas oryzagri]MDH7639582.1 hypothetical protein [Sphingomonas oryzagri]
MTDIRLSAAVAAALAGAEARVAAAIAAEVPADVRVSLDERGIALTGRDLSARSLTDARLRDFAGLVR